MSALVSATDCRELGKVPKTKKEKEREKSFLEAPVGRLPSVTSYKQGLVNLRTLGRNRGWAPVVPNKQNDCLKCEDLDAGAKQGKHRPRASISSTELRTRSRWPQGRLGQQADFQSKSRIRHVAYYVSGPFTCRLGSSKWHACMLSRFTRV